MSSYESRRIEELEDRTRKLEASLETKEEEIDRLKEKYRILKEKITGNPWKKKFYP